VKTIQDDFAGRRPAEPDRCRTPAPLDATAVAGWGGARPDRITQDELRRYHARKDELRRLEQELEALRAGLIERLAADVPVEPGPYRARAAMYQQQMLTATKLREVLSEAEVEDLLARVAPTSRINLYVTLGK
jgi:hypothetical protein